MSDLSTLASLMRWQTVWFWYTCHLHLCHITRFQRVEAPLFQTVIGGCHLELPASEVAESSFHQKTSNTLCSLLLVQSAFFYITTFFLLAWVPAATPREAFSCWCSAAACRAVAEQPCWSHMAVFAWWGFTASKMPSNMSQLTFSVNECELVCVCVCVQLLKKQQVFFRASLRGIKVTQTVTKAASVSGGEPWSAQTYFAFH